MLYAKLIGRIALFTCENIARIKLYLQGLLPEILAIYTINVFTGSSQTIATKVSLSLVIYFKKQTFFLQEIITL